MDKIEIVKKAVSLIVGASVGHCITSIMTSSLAPKNVREKIEVAVGAYVVGAMFAAAAKDWVDVQSDEMLERYHDYIQKRLDK